MWIIKMELSIEEKRILISVAKNAVEKEFNNIPPIEVDFQKYPLLNSTSGAFVTLTRDDRLRGCIGYIISDKPLVDTVTEAAVQAAKHDPRFPSISFEEFPNIDFEISVLSKPFPMESYEDIILGQHGLILTEQGRRGLLLPQVPIEHNMNKEEYLNALCQKAGFHPDLWKEKQLKLEAFTALVFSEKELEE
jgi:AmmeMemoRadiSam system protein A